MKTDAEHVRDIEGLIGHLKEAIKDAENAGLKILICGHMRESRLKLIVATRNYLKDKQS